MPAVSASFCAASRCRRASLSFALRSALNSKTARLAAPLLSKSVAATSPTPVRWSSAINAPRESDAIASIVPARGPRPNRCSANAAALASRVIGVILAGSLGHYASLRAQISPHFLTTRDPAKRGRFHRQSHPEIYRLLRAPGGGTRGASVSPLGAEPVI